jgi:hypothetical protein
MNTPVVIPEGVDPMSFATGALCALLDPLSDAERVTVFRAMGLSTEPSDECPHCRT